CVFVARHRDSAHRRGSLHGIRTVSLVARSVTALDARRSATGPGAARALPSGVRRRRRFGIVALAALAWLASVGRADAQFGALFSPGALAKAHAELEGISNCQKCHEQGKRVTAQKCLACHA